MDMFTIKFQKDGEEQATRLFADDAKAAINEFLTKNNRIEPNEVVSVTSHRPLTKRKDSPIGAESDKDNEQDEIHSGGVRGNTDDSVASEKTQKHSNSMEDIFISDEDIEAQKRGGKDASISEQPTPNEPGKTDWKLVLGVSLFLGIGIIIGIGAYLKDASFTLDILGDSYGSEWDSYPVNFRSLREDSKNKDAHFVQGTNFAIEDRYGHRDYVQENKDGTRWAMVTSLSNRLPFSWTVDCDQRKLKIESGFEEEPGKWKKPEIGTQGFAVAATICQIPFTPSY
jgi:hypothetical protein